MTKKDYEMIASVFKKQSDFEKLYFSGLTPLEQANGERIYRHNLAIIQNFAEIFANRLAEEDKRFKRDQFLKECGVTD